jgi:uncharacterized membrane protein YfcA
MNGWLSDVLLSLVNFLTSTMTAITGLAGGMILIGIMPLFLPAFAIVPVHGATQLASNVSRAWFGRQHLRFGDVLPYMAGSLLGACVFGVAVYFVQLDFIPLFIGIYILMTQWSQSFNHLLKSVENFYVIGFLQIGIGLFVGATGPLHVPLLFKKYPDTHVAITTSSFLMSIMHILKIAVYVLTGFAFLDYWQVIMMMIVSAVIGSWVGVKLRHRFSMHWLKRALPWLLSVIALKLIITTALNLVKL